MDSPRPKNELRRYTPADREAVLSLFGEVFGPEPEAVARRTWTWKHERNPHAAPGGTRMFVSTSEGRVVGLIGTLADTVQVRGNTLPAVWGVDFAVHPDHRGRGIRLLKQWLDSQTDAVQLGSPIGRAYEFERRLGPLDACQMVTYKCILRPGRVARAKKVSFARGAALVAAAHAVAAGMRVTGSPAAPAGLRVETASSYDTRFDALWQRAAPGYEVIGVRDRRHLDWRYGQCPHRTYTCLTAEGEGGLRAYLIYRLEQAGGLLYGHIIDWFAGRSDARAAGGVLAAALRAMRTAGVDMATCMMVPEQQPYARLLRRNGFVFRGGAIHLIWGPQGLAAESLPKVRDWFFMRGNSDVEMA